MPDTDTDTTLQDLTEAQRNRPAEEVGPTSEHPFTRRTTADETDVYKAWTVQSGVPFPTEGYGPGPVTRFAPSELPDQEKAIASGLLPLTIGEALIDPENVTQPPSSNIDADDPIRDKFRGDPGFAAFQATNVEANRVAAPAAEAEAEAEAKTETEDVPSGDGSSLAFTPGVAG